MDVEETTVAAADGTRLFVRRCRSIQPASRTLVIVHGMSEHGGRYDHVVRLFQDRGWNVIVGDLRGHGRSGGTPTHVRSFREYVDDLAVIWDHFRLRAERTALLGHSMGSLVAVRFAQSRPEAAVPMVLLSPLLGVTVPIDRPTLIAGRLLSWVAPRFRFQSRIDPAHTTRNEAVLVARQTDTLMHRSVTARWYFAMKSAMAAAWRDAAALTAPVLVLQAGADRIVDPAAPARWLKRTAGDNQSLRIFEGHFHELHHEPGWREILSAAADWLDVHVPAAAVRAVNAVECAPVR